MSTLHNWTIGSYQGDGWQTLAKGPAIIRSIIIANVGRSSAQVEARIADGTQIERAVILPSAGIEGGDSRVVDLCQLNLGPSDTLQFRFSETGVINITASGEIAS